ncbi:MAG: recombinase family protein [Eggerthellaceae bacterium]|nr:recombinase family protein [Eggerthellaceae bacterium]
MKRTVTTRKGRDNTAHLYLRLSRDDNLDGESYSISNQKQLLTKVAKEAGYTNLICHVDDGISGVTMERPGFIEMIGQIEDGIGSAVFVKDMSRLGRNYLKVGYYTEEFFPEYDIRFVAVSDAIDSADGENEIAPIKNLFNEWYSRDISKKKRLSNRVRGSTGIPMGRPPYGYILDPDDPHHWVIEPEAAEVVRRIYRMTTGGFGTEQIAKALEDDGILTPYFYWKAQGINRPGSGGKALQERPPCKWNSSTIVKILQTQEYCGDVINFKTYSKSYKNKTRLENDPENWAVFEGVHEPIIERAVWQQIQEKRGTRRKRKKKDGETNMFCGLLVCADCGHNLWYHFNQGNPEITYFNCSNYKGNRGDCKSTHYIRVDFLEQVVMLELRRLMRFAVHYEDEFAALVMGHSKNVVEFDRQYKQKEMAGAISRYDEIDRLFERMYEDNASSKISDERFYTMSKRYESEQVELSDKIKALKSEIDKKDDRAMTASMFLRIVRKYTRVKKLTQPMLNELIGHIEVHQAEKIDGEHHQKLVIHYNCVGNIEIPKILKLPDADVRIQTRQGVAVRYAAQGAV